MPRLLTTKELAAALAIDVDVLERAAAQGLLPGFAFGQTWVVVDRELVDWLESELEPSEKQRWLELLA